MNDGEEDAEHTIGRAAALFVLGTLNLSAVATVLAVVLVIALASPTKGEEAPALDCRFKVLAQKRAQLLEPALRRAYETARLMVERGARAHETAEAFAAAFWRSLFAIENSAEWHIWKNRSEACGVKPSVGN